MVMSLFHSVSDLIGHTPLLQLHKLDTGPCSLFLKLENQNPGGSIKDRVALSINEAERQGKLAPGERLSKPPAGNTGLGLALIAAQKNYRLIPVVPDKMSREKISSPAGAGARRCCSPAPTSIKATRPTTGIMPAALPMKRRAPLYRPV